MPREDLTGRVFGKLTVKYLDHVDSRKQPYWFCICECTNEKIARGGELKNGTFTSCKECGRKRGSDKRKISNRKYNVFEKKDDYYIGYTTKNEEFYFDIDDFDKVSQYCWFKIKRGYIVTNTNINGKKKRLKLHHLIMNNQKGVDHIKPNKIDNRKSNLQICTQQNNLIKKSIQRNNTSGIIGISWDKRKCYYHTYITIDGKRKNLGYFNHNEFEKAIICRLKAEKEYFKEFAPQKHLFKQYGIE